MILYEGTDERLNETMTAYELVASKLTANLKKHPATFELITPAMITVQTGGGNFTKESHIGGETLSPIRCYVGKRNSLIFVFKPTVPDYLFAEITLSDARKFFGKTFTTYANSYGAKEIDALVLEAKIDARLVRETKISEAKGDTYAKIGWGDF